MKVTDLLKPFCLVVLGCAHLLLGARPIWSDQVRHPDRCISELSSHSGQVYIRGFLISLVS